MTAGMDVCIRAEQNQIGKYKLIEKAGVRARQMLTTRSHLAARPSDQTILINIISNLIDKYALSSPPPRICNLRRVNRQKRRKRGKRETPRVNYARGATHRIGKNCATNCPWGHRGPLARHSIYLLLLVRLLHL